MYVKAGLEREKAAVMVNAVAGYRESTQSRPDVLRGLRERGVGCPKLVVGDGHLGIWEALRNVYPDASEQRCWNHKIINVLDRLMLRTIPYTDSRAETERLRSGFSRWCRGHSYEAASEILEVESPFAALRLRPMRSSATREWTAL